MESDRRLSQARRAAFVGSIALIAACSAQQSSGPGAITSNAPKSSGEPVQLKFAWPDGLRAEVRTISVKSQSLGPQSRTQDMTANYVMSAQHDERGVAAKFDQFQVNRPDASPIDREVEKVLAYRPGFLMDNTGQLIEVQGLEILRDLLLPLEKRLETATEEEKQTLGAVGQTVTSEQYLKARAAAEWGNMIGTWLDQELKLGGVVTREEESATTGLTDKPIASKVKVAVSRATTCERSGAKQCVRLSLTREPDQQALREAITPNLGKMLGVEDWGPDGPPKLAGVEATTQLIVDTEAETLVPHRIESLRVFSLDIEREEGILKVRDSNRSTTNYTYR